MLVIYRNLCPEWCTYIYSILFASLEHHDPDFRKISKGAKNIHVLQHFRNYLYSCMLGIARFNRKVKSSVLKGFHCWVVAKAERKG